MGRLRVKKKRFLPEGAVGDIKAAAALWSRVPAAIRWEIICWLGSLKQRRWPWVRPSKNVKTFATAAGGILWAAHRANQMEEQRNTSGKADVFADADITTQYRKTEKEPK